MSGCWVHRFSVLILMLDSISTEVHYVEICGLSFPGMWHWKCHAMSEDKLITLFEIQTPSCHQAMAAMVVVVDLIITIYIYIDTAGKSAAYCIFIPNTIQVLVIICFV